MTRDQRFNFEVLIQSAKPRTDNERAFVALAELALAELNAAEAERDKLIAAWPTISQHGNESGGPVLYGPFDEHWYHHTIGGLWPTPNPGGRPTREAAVRAAAEIAEGGGT